MFLFGSLLKNTMKIFLKYYNLKQCMTETVCRPSMQNGNHKVRLDNREEYRLPEIT